MMRCLELAQKGMGRVSPNPMVGAVLVCNDRIVGSGFHRSYGGPHAEVYAIEAAPDPGVLKQSTLYVNLEPCAHHGKTPPCAELVINSGIPRVVVAQQDPNPLVSGKGIALMREAGIQVTVGICEAESRHLNRRFNTFHTAGRPYVVLKWARSMDGFMDVNRDDNTEQGVHWISHPSTKKLVHRWRAEEAAIMVGATTLANDDPSLTTRDFAGRQPHRIVLSQRGNLAVKSRLFHDGMPVEVISQKGGPVSPLLAANGQLQWTVSQGDENLVETALRSLYAKGITSVLVEGGAETLGSFLALNLWDEVRIITSPRAMGSGKPAPHLDMIPEQQVYFGEDLISTFYRQ